MNQASHYRATVPSRLTLKGSMYRAQEYLDLVCIKLLCVKRGRYDEMYPRYPMNLGKMYPRYPMTLSNRTLNSNTVMPESYQLKPDLYLAELQDLQAEENRRPPTIAFLSMFTRI